MAPDKTAGKMRNTFIGLLLLSTILLGACSILPAAPVQLPRPEVSLFKADRSNIEKGSSTTLLWEVKGADTIIIDGGVGSVPSTGSREIKPTGISAYNLTASNAGGTVVCSVIINVKPFVKVTPTTTTASAATGPPAALQVLPKLAKTDSYVFYGDAVMVGADDHYVVLRNNPAAHNPTWAELKAFLQADMTERHAYVPGKYTCGDFAETLHNNAEAAGIRAGLVAIELMPANMADGVVNHSLNMFETTDRGLVYIDDTSSSQGYYADRIGDVAVGKDYVSVSIFPQPGQMQTWPSMGKVLAFDIQQW
jgi:hypothetical protein